MDRLSRLHNSKNVNCRPRMGRTWSRQSPEKIERRKSSPDSDEILSEKSPEKMNFSGLCGNCHLTVCHENHSGDIGGSNRPFRCNRGHLMCPRCVQHLGNQSGKACNLCGSESQNSPSSSSSFESLTDNNNSSSKINNENFCHYNSERGPSDAIEKTINQPSVSSSDLRVIGQITNECSRRPIRCPRLDCAVNVAFSSLTHHFLFDHPEVPVLSIEPTTKSSLIISFADLPSESSICIALLLVSNKLSGTTARLFNGNHIHPNYRDRLPLPVLAARLNATDQEGQKGEIVIAWVAGLDIASVGALCCSIQVVDSLDDDKIRSLTYTGPINSLKTAQKPRQVFHSGDCIVLHQGLLKNLTINSSNFYINIVIH